MYKILIFLSLTIMSVDAVDDGRYRPEQHNSVRYINANDGRYVHTDEGKYIHVGDGFRGYYTETPSQYRSQLGIISNPNEEESAAPDSDYYSRLPPAEQSPDLPTLEQSNFELPEEYYSFDEAAIPETTSNSLSVGEIITANEEVNTPTAGIGIYDDSGRETEENTKRNGDELYHYLYKAKGDIVAEEVGTIQKTGTDDEAVRATGFYEYTGADGKIYRVDYTADEDGFVPRGAHIPPLPESTKRLLAYLDKKLIKAVK